MSLSNSDIKKQFIQIFDKLQSPPTKDVAYEIYKKLILKSTFNEPQMMFIIQQVNDYLISFNKSNKEKEPALKLLSLTFFQPEHAQLQNNKLYLYKYISPTLTIIQSLITDSNSNLFQSLSSTFADMIQFILPTDIDSSYLEMEIEEKRIYEMIQGFCLQNMAVDEKANRLVGSMFLTRLVENCPLVLKEEYMRVIWDNITGYLEKSNFNAKYELLNCLISLILGSEGRFRPYANSTLYKVFEFLTDVDWLKRKLALNVIYTIIHYCNEEISQVKEQLIGLLKLLKFDKVKEVRDICLLILDVLNTKDNKNVVVNSNNSNNNSNKVRKINNLNNNNTRDDKNFSVNVPNTTQKPTQQKEQNELSYNNNITNNNVHKKLINRKKESIHQNKLSKRKQSKDFILVEKNQETPITSSTSNNNIIQFNDISNDNVNIMSQKSTDNLSFNKRSMTPNRPKSKGRIANTNKNDISSTTTNDELNTSANKIVHTTGTSLRNNINKVNVNRKDDKTFVNEKMVIKHDPNHSIFKMKPNKAFFNNAKKQQDIIVLDKQPKNMDRNDVIEEEYTKNNVENDDIEMKDEREGICNNENINKIDDENKIEIDNNTVLAINKENKGNFLNENKIDYIDTITETSTNNIHVNEDNNINENIKPINLNTNSNHIKNDIKTVYSNRKKENKRLKQPSTIPPEKSNIVTTNNNTMYSPELINTLLSQINSLSSKQLLLLDTLDSLQSQTLSEINSLNSKIQSLSSTVSSLSAQLNLLQQSNNQNQFNHHNEINEAFKSALYSTGEQQILDLITQTPMNKYGDVEISYLEKTIVRLIATLSKGDNVKDILTFYKNIILCLKCPLSNVTTQNVKDILEYLLENNDNYYHLNDDDLVDISVLLANIDKQES